MYNVHYLSKCHQIPHLPYSEQKKFREKTSPISTRLDILATKYIGAYLVSSRH